MITFLKTSVPVINRLLYKIFFFLKLKHKVNYKKLVGLLLSYKILIQTIFKEHFVRGRKKKQVMITPIKVSYLTKY